MGAVYTDTQKKATYKWRNDNRDKKRATDVKHIRWKRGRMLYLAILLDYEL
jgi:hypothetical protein